MNKKQTHLLKSFRRFFGFTFVIFSIPLFSLAAGLVPCGGPAENPCTACDLLVLAENILHFMVKAAFAIIVISAIIAGFQMIFSGGNEKNFQTALKALNNAILGLIIIFAAYLIINTVFWLVAQMGGADYTGNWWYIKCAPSQTNFNNFQSPIAFISFPK